MVRQYSTRNHSSCVQFAMITNLGGGTWIYSQSLTAVYAHTDFTMLNASPIITYILYLILTMYTYYYEHHYYHIIIIILNPDY